MGSGAGGSLVPGSSAVSGLGRFTSPKANFLFNRRRWWCCGPPRRKKSSLKISIVSITERHLFVFLICFFFFI